MFNYVLGRLLSIFGLILQDVGAAAAQLLRLVLSDANLGFSLPTFCVDPAWANWSYADVQLDCVASWQKC